MINRIKNTQERPARLPKACKYCGSIGHTAFTCNRKPRKPIKVTARLKAKGRIRRIGKVTNKWLKTRAIWFELHDTPTYMCYICGKLMAKAETTLDHKLSRGRHPELRYELSNLAPCCLPCNEAKGSLDIQEYLEKTNKS